MGMGLHSCGLRPQRSSDINVFQQSTEEGQLNIIAYLGKELVFWEVVAVFVFDD